jgi:hypothetical protein
MEVIKMQNDMWAVSTNAYIMIGKNRSREERKYRGTPYPAWLA